MSGAASSGKRSKPSLRKEWSACVRVTVAHVLPRRDWSLLDRDVLGWLVGGGEPDRDLLMAIQEVRLIIEPAAAALAATRSTKQDRLRIEAALVGMETSHDQESAIKADKAFHLAILDATHNPVLQGFAAPSIPF